MKYSELSSAYEELEATQSKLEKAGIIARLLRKSGRHLYMVSLLLQGRVFPAYDDREMGIAVQSMEGIISRAAGFSQADVRARYNELGDFGLVAQEMMKKRKQRTLASRELDVGMVFKNMQKLAEIGGKGSQERKFGLVAELMTSAGPKEAKWIARTCTGDLRIGVAEGTMRDAVAEAFLDTSAPETKKEAVSSVEWAWFIRPDYGEVAEVARDGGMKGLEGLKLEVGKPYHVLLAEKSPCLKEALESFEHPALEFKYDGARICIHKKGDRLWFFTRRLENITRQFPELQEYVKKGVRAGECILEGEMVGFDRRAGRPMPFQFLSQRIKRKYDIGRMAEEIPIRVSLFDIVYLEGKALFDLPLRERWAKLKGIVNPSKGFQLAEHMETKDLGKADAFYRAALGASQEGLIVKDLDAKYHPGRRVAGGWLKVKPVMETLDLAIIGATWGTGKRAGWMGSFTLGCRDGDEFKACGMIGTGVKEKKAEGSVTLQELTELLKPNIVGEKGSELKIKPDVIAEVAYEEIQKSPTYESGYALRFPRVLKLRPDKDVSEADTTARIERLFAQQKGKSG